MFADIERRREEFILKLNAKRMEQSREAAANAFDEAVAFFCDPKNEYLIKDGNIDGLVIQRADWLLSHDFRRDKKHVKLDGNRDRAWIDAALVERMLDIEAYLATLPEPKRELLRLVLEEYSHAEIAKKLGVPNNVALRKRISRLKEDLRNFLEKN